jgi:hypothetical protein
VTDIEVTLITVAFGVAYVAIARGVPHVFDLRENRGEIVQRNRLTTALRIAEIAGWMLLALAAIFGLVAALV